MSTGKTKTKSRKTSRTSLVKKTGASAKAQNQPRLEKNKIRPITDLRVADLEDLRIRLEEAEATLSAIRGGEVDALVVHGRQGEQVFTLKGADQPYLVIVERMNEGAVTVSPEGTLLYANRRYAQLAGMKLDKVI